MNGGNHHHGRRSYIVTPKLLPRSGSPFFFFRRPLRTALRRKTFERDEKEQKCIRRTFIRPFCCYQKAFPIEIRKGEDVSLYSCYRDCRRNAHWCVALAVVCHPRRRRRIFLIFSIARSLLSCLYDVQIIHSFLSDP